MEIDKRNVHDLWIRYFKIYAKNFNFQDEIHKFPYEKLILKLLISVRPSLSYLSTYISRNVEGVRTLIFSIPNMNRTSLIGCVNEFVIVPSIVST